MRHGKKFNHLGRKAAHRKALLRNMAISLIEHKSIKTTLPKARELRKFIEPLITKSKTDTMHSRRTVFSYLQNKDAVKELFGEISERVGDRPGGYTRILKLGNRRGDNAEMALIELVDYNEYGYTQGSEGSTSNRRRRRRRRGGNKPAAQVAAPVEEAVVEDVVETAPEVVEEVTSPIEDAEVVEETVEAVEEAAAEETAAPEEGDDAEKPTE
ncbi:MAG: 50S ribosomal protein L17 [Bacteroidota bacterium]